MINKSNNNHQCHSILVSCMDFRLQGFINDWTAKNIKGGFDRVAIAGGVKNLPFVIEQIEISHRLHHIQEVFLINHEDCGAYGKEGTLEKHQNDLLLAKKAIGEKFPQLKVTLFYLKLNGEFVNLL